MSNVAEHPPIATLANREADIFQELLNHFKGNKESCYNTEFFKAILTLFARSVVNNEGGEDYVTNLAKFEWEIAHLDSFAASETLSNQVNFAIPVLNTLWQATSDSRTPEAKTLNKIIERSKQGEIIFSRILYKPEQTPCSQQGPFDVTAVERNGGWLLNGTLETVLLNGSASHHLIIATTPNNTNIVVCLPVHTKGFDTVQSALLGHARDDNHFKVASIALNGLFVNHSSVLGGLTTTEAITIISRGRIMSSIRNNQLVRICLDNIIEFLKSRLSNGDPLINQQVIRHRLASLEARLSTSKALSQHSLDHISAADEIQMLSSASKLLSTELLLSTSKQALHLGGITHFQKNKTLSTRYLEANWAKFFLEPREILIRNILATTAHNDNMVTPHEAK